MWKYAKGYYKYAILSPLFVAIESGVEIIIPYLLSLIINYLDFVMGNTSISKIPDGWTSSQYVWTIGGIAIGLAVIALIAGFFSAYTATKASAGLGKNLREALYKKIQTFSFENIDKFSDASLITRLTTDVTNVQQSFQMTIRICFRAPILFIFGIIMAYLLNPGLANYFAIGAPILLVLVGLFFYPANKNFRAMFKKIDRMNQVEQENINGIKTVKSYTNEGYETMKFQKAADDVRKFATRGDTFGSLIIPVAQFVIYAVLLIIYYFGSISIADGQMGSGELTAFITYGSQILFAILMVAAISLMLLMSHSSQVRINEVLNEKPALKEKSNPIETVRNGNVEFDNVSFSYSKSAEKYSLKNISFKAKSGEIIGIFGSTGSSKTTLINLIDRLYDATSGSVKIGDIDVKDYSLYSLREAVGTVLQKNVLFSGTIRSNMKWGNKEATDEEITKALDQAQASEFIFSNPDGLDAKVEEGGANYSGGQKQRLCIARALIKRPRILILDDSTSAVDTKTDALIQQAFRNEIPQTTKFIISQRISSIQSADHIMILENGEMKAFGNHEELLKTSKIYKDIYQAQMKSAPKKEVR